MKMMTMTPMLAIAMTTAMALSLGPMTAPAVAQDALGAGDALDANLNPYTGRRNLPAPQPDFRARNLLITGDVAGGRGFRGSVGYTADTDFRGGLASDDLFQFRAGAAFSSPQAIQAGRVADQFRFGYDMGQFEYRRFDPMPGTRRAPDIPDFEDRTRRALEDDDFWSGLRVREEWELDRMTQAASMTEMMDSLIRPQPVGLLRDTEGRPYVASVSGLRGLATMPAEEMLVTQGMSPYDVARLRREAAETGEPPRIGRPYRIEFEDLRERPLRDQLTIDERREADRFVIDDDTEHVRILESIARRYAGMEEADLQIDRSVLAELDDEFRSLREQLMPRDRARRDAARPEDRLDTRRRAELERERLRPGTRIVEAEPADRAPDRPGERPDRMGMPDEDLPAREPAPRSPREAWQEMLEDDDFALMLRHGRRVEHLSGAESTRFNEIMSAGEQALRDGEYFLAERQFTRALRFSPNHPLATVGAAHAQMGAGLNIAAGLTLRRLFAHNPEMIDTRYHDDLLPSRPRLNETIDALRRRVDDPRDRSSLKFLLAYIGHQLGDRDLVREGLDAMAEAAPHDQLLPLLERIWLADEDSAAGQGRRTPREAPDEPNGNTAPGDAPEK